MDNQTPDDSTAVIGRFAPSPTGHLHFGSLITAIASYCHSKHQQGKWLVRIEDTDWQRCKPEFSNDILHTLERFGFKWDDAVLYQSQHLDRYEGALAQLLSQKHAYACECSRKILHDYAKAHKTNPATYPRLCINKQLNIAEKNIRLVVPNTQLSFVDSVQGQIDINPQASLGDMILKRRDGIVNYILSAALDDAHQGVTHVIRGLDLLDLTPVQITLANMLGLKKIEQYGHLPLALNSSNQKLSKQTKAQPLNTDHAPKFIQMALLALKQSRVDFDKPDIMLHQAALQWDIQALTLQKEVQGRFK